MRKGMMVFLILIFFLVSCNTQSVDIEGIQKVLQEYRETKSSEYVLTGKQMTPRVESYLHADFFTQANNPSPKIIILDDSFIFKEVRREKDSYFSRKYPNKCYSVDGDEICLGEVVDGEVKYYEEKKVYQTGYLFLLTKDGPLVLMEGMFNNFYVLNKDVPALLSKMKSGQKEE